MNKKEKIEFLKEELNRLEGMELISRRDLNMAEGAELRETDGKKIKQIQDGKKTLKNSLSFIKGQIRYTNYLLEEVEEEK